MKITSGLILFRRINNKLEVFLVHPGGPIWSKKDLGVWSIPKGIPEMDESFEAASIREFSEETGNKQDINVQSLISLGEHKIYSGKEMYCFAFEKDIGEISVNSNYFELEWPPKSGKLQKFKESDKGMYFDVQTARLKLNKHQLIFLDRLEEYLNK